MLCNQVKNPIGFSAIIDSMFCRSNPELLRWIVSGSAMRKGVAALFMILLRRCNVENVDCYNNIKLQISNTIINEDPGVNRGG